MDMMLLIYCA